ncbi:hypothetical protein D3C78_1603530 [compost metagenome]
MVVEVVFQGATLLPDRLGFTQELGVLEVAVQSLANAHGEDVAGGEGEDVFGILNAHGVAPCCLWWTDKSSLTLFPFDSIATRLL